jgi:DNA replication protein DnaC
MVEAGQLKTTSEDNVCPRCYGTGFEVTERGAKKCRCRIVALIAERLTLIPPRYASVSLDELTGQKERHPKQPLAVELMKRCPFESYVLCGRPDTGKTHLMWSLYQKVVHDTNRRVVACSMLQLINDYREAFKPVPEGAQPYEIKTVRPNDLMQSHTPYSLFFDDIDKPKITEYVAEQVHALFDAAYINKHQIVITTNLTPDRLVEHFERADDRYGRAIVRRIVHSENNLIEMF